MTPEMLALVATVAFTANLIAVVVAIFKLGTAVGRFENIGKQQATEIAALKDTVKEIARLVTESALQTQRLDNMSNRLNRHEGLIDDLRRGEGFILPLNRGAHEIK